jgi:GNAT superfamily N-acetyltransferase
LDSLKLPQNVDRRVEKLRPDHAIDSFDCGSEELNRFLQRHAIQSQQADGSRTYVGLVGEAVVGFYTLVVGSVARESAPGRVIKGLAKHPVPIMLLARLGADRKWQRQGIGSGLLKNAMLRTLQAADHAGISALVIHAKNDEVKRFYGHFGFTASPTDALHLFIVLKDVRALHLQPNQ